MTNVEVKKKNFQDLMYFTFLALLYAYTCITFFSQLYGSNEEDCLKDDDVLCDLVTCDLLTMAESYMDIIFMYSI